SDLFDNRTAQEIDIDAETGTVEPVDIDLASDQPSLTSAPSSIFSGSKPATGSGSEGRASLEPTDPELDEAEFSPNPAPGDSAKGAGARRPSSADFELPDDVPAVPAADDAGAVDWNNVAEDENATRGIPQDASLSALMRELTDDSNESPT